MTPAQFVAKWADLKNRLNEIAAAQAHFNDICDLVEHPRPYEGDQATDDFRFEKPTDKQNGGKGRADVFYRAKFIWEYKGYHGNLDKAYQQVQRYREALGNPPLLIVSDLETIRIHTNFTNTISQRTDIKLSELLQPEKLNELKQCFAHPADIERFFKPEKTQEAITRASAATFIHVVDQLRAFDTTNTPPEKFAHFIARLLFCLFAEDMGLLPDKLIQKMSAYLMGNGAVFERALRLLFATMRRGGLFGYHDIPFFDGNLFEDDLAPPLPSALPRTLLQAARQDWSGIEPSIFGTLFERVIDKEKRAQLGAHYTSRDDIMLIVEPVLMQPLRVEWEQVRQQANRAQRKGNNAQAHQRLTTFADKIAATTVLDPACGSGNFLYVALRQMLGLQKAVIIHAERQGLPVIPLTVSPRQLHGIEINPYAHQLAQITIWIGYLQWRKENGFELHQEPILQPLDQIERKDAILAYDSNGNPAQPAWPNTTVIIGNPPFLGGNKIRQELGDDYVDDLFELYQAIPSFSDLVCYWFEQGRQKVARGQVNRVGYVATNSISGGVNKRVLERIKHQGNIFYAWSDRAWVLEGAAVRIAIVGFDNGEQSTIRLNSATVEQINPDLTGYRFYVSGAKRLFENAGISFMGPSAKGPFDINQGVAREMLNAVNPTGKSNAEVIRPVASATDLVKNNRHKYTIDFGLMSATEAADYMLPFQYVKETVYPTRKNKRGALSARWWQYGRPRVEMRDALRNLQRYVVTPGVSKHRIFVWMSTEVLCNQGTIVFAREDDYFLGVLHSRVHETWSLHKGTWLGKGNDPRYTSTTAFETFPFPWALGGEPSETEDENVGEIAELARELVAFRQAWLHPPAEDVGVLISEKMLRRRTLTNMYNALVHYREARSASKLHDLAFKTAWKQTVKSDFTSAQAETLHDIHTELDEAVLRAYGWPIDLSDEQILENLLALNLERAKTQGGGAD